MYSLEMIHPFSKSLFGYFLTLISLHASNDFTNGYGSLSSGPDSKGSITAPDSIDSSTDVPYTDAIADIADT